MLFIEMKYLLFIRGLRFIGIIFMLMSLNIYSQDGSNQLYELLNEYEISLSFAKSEITDDIGSLDSFTNLFLSGTSYVVNDIAENTDRSVEYLTVNDYVSKVKEKFEGEVTVKLYNFKILDIEFFKNYLVYKVSVKKSIEGETTSEEFFNRKLDLVFEVIRFYSSEEERLKILKILPEGGSIVSNKEKEHALLSGIDLYLSPGISSLKFSASDVSASDYSGFSSKSDFAIKVGGNLLFNLFSGEKTSCQIGVGMSYIGYSSSLGLESYNTGYYEFDKDDDKYYKLVSGSNLQQNIKLSYFEIPLFLQTNFHFNNYSLYLNAGLQLGVATNKLYTTDEGLVNYKGQYVIVDENGVNYDFVLEDLEEYGFGTYSVNQSEQEIDIDPINLSFLLSTGISYPLNESFAFTGGIDFVSGLSNIKINNSTPELISNNNINSIITLSTGFKTGFVGLKLGIHYKFNKPEKPVDLQEDGLIIADYVSPHNYDSTAFSSEKDNNFALHSDYSGFNLYYLDLSDERIDRAKVKKILGNSLDSVNNRSGSYFVFLSNFNKPVIAEPGDGYEDVMKQINFITPDLPDVNSDLSFLLESLNSHKGIKNNSRVNLFFFFSDSFYKYQSDGMIEKLKDYFAGSDLQVYIFFNNYIDQDVEINKYNYRFYNFNFGGK
jgi:hypothetical protein